MFLRFFLLLSLVTGSLLVHAQPSMDPTFTTPRAYTPTGVRQALQLNDGSRVLLADFRFGYEAFERINGQDVGGIVLCRFTTAGQPDAVFNTRMISHAAQGFLPAQVAEYPGNRLLVVLYYPFTTGGRTYNSLMRLNADGTVDATFASPTPFYPGQEGTCAVQPDGKILLTNQDAQPVGTPSRALVRLLPNGTLDQPFLMQLGNSLPTGSRVEAIYLQTDGKMVISGTFYVSAGGNIVRTGMLRLLPSGLEDTSLQPPPSLRHAYVRAVQPDNKILISPNSTFLTPSPLVRLLVTGAVDASFNPPADLGAASIFVQPDGRILVAGRIDATQAVPNGDYSNVAYTFLLRLLPAGALDASLQVPGYGNYFVYPNSLQVLPNGQLLVASQPKIYASATAVPIGVAVLDANGTYQSSFAPTLQMNGTINSVVVQANGQLVAGGQFSEINGVTARNVARFDANGTVDAAFTAVATATGGSETVSQVALQPDGKVLICGDFSALGGQPRPAIARLLPTGQLDAGFVPALAGNSTLHVNEITSVALQPDGQVLLSGYSIYATTSPMQPRVLVRLTAAGGVDGSFQPPLAVQVGLDFRLHPAAPLLVQPDGNILVADVYYVTSPTTSVSQPVIRLLPTGTLDASFVRPVPSSAGIGSVFGMSLYPDGRLLVYGDLYLFDGTNSPLNKVAARLQPNGTIDPTFSSPLGRGIAYSSAIQPNGRILLHGQLTSQPGTFSIQFIRLQPLGTRDNSFSGPQLPGYIIKNITLQPNGAILVGGDFLNPLTQEPTILARLIDPNVLPTTLALPAAAPQAYPNPAHDRLHLTLDAARRPQQVHLLDATGRAVRHWPAAPTLDLTGLPAGLYLLRVAYEGGETQTQRVVVE